MIFKPQAEEKGIDFIFRCPKHYPQFIYADEKRIRQILINLLSNVIKFTQHAGVEFYLNYRNQVAQFTVKGTGSRQITCSNLLFLLIRMAKEAIVFIINTCNIIEIFNCCYFLACFCELLKSNLKRNTLR